MKIRSVLAFLLPIIGLTWLGARGLRVRKRIASEVSMLRGMGRTPRRLSRTKR